MKLVKTINPEWGIEIITANDFVTKHNACSGCERAFQVGEKIALFDDCWCGIRVCADCAKRMYEEIGRTKDE